MLSGVRPRVARGRDTQLLTVILDDAAQRIGRELNEEMEVQGDLLITIGSAYEELGNYAASEIALRHALAAYQREFRHEHWKIAHALTHIALATFRQDRLEEAELVFCAALEMLKRLPGPDGTYLAEAYNGLACVLMQEQKLSEAEATIREALSFQCKSSEATNQQGMAALLGNLAETVSCLGRFSEAAPLAHACLAMMQQASGPDHFEIADSLDLLGSSFLREGRPAEAEEMLRKALELRRKFFGPAHPQVAITLDLLSQALSAEANLTEAEQLGRESLKILQGGTGTESVALLQCLDNVAPIIWRNGKLDEAESLFREALRVRSKLRVPDESGDELKGLSVVLIQQGRHFEAIGTEERLLALQCGTLGSLHPRTLETMTALAALYVNAGRMAEGFNMLEELLVLQKQTIGSEHPDIIPAMFMLAAGYQQQGRLFEAEKLFDEALAAQIQISGSDAPQTMQMMGLRAMGYVEAHKPAEAEKVLKELLVRQRKLLGETHPDTLDTARKLQKAYWMQGKVSEAESLAVPGKMVPSTGQEKAEIAATVNGSPISEQKVRNQSSREMEALKRRFEKEPDLLSKKVTELRNNALEQLINEELIVQEFDHQGFDVPSEILDTQMAERIQQHYSGDTNLFFKVLAAEGLTVEAFRQRLRRQLIVQSMRQNHLKDLPKPSHVAIEQFYHLHQTNYWHNEAVDLALITIHKQSTNLQASSRTPAQLATDIHSRLEQGADFATEARLYSQGSHATNGGSYGWIERTFLRPELEQEAFSLLPGTFSKVVETLDALYILHVKARRPPSLTSLTEVETLIRNHLVTELRQTAEQHWINDLRSNAAIVRRRSETSP